jgi:predicted nucleic acid-binding Zn ribbon protein
VSRNIVPAGGAIYTMERNVELYFAEVIGYRADLTPQSAKRAMWALQQRLADDERVGNATKWEIKDSARVKEALEAQERRYKERMAAAVIDPHCNLSTNMIKPQESRKAMTFTMQDADNCNWQNLGICWTGGDSMFLCNDSMRKFLRNDSMCKFLLTDLLTLNTHGPRKDAPFDQDMLGLIYQKGTHKDHQGRQRIVGSWRQLYFIQDFTGMVAMSLFVHFCSGGSGLDFHKPANPSEKPAWWSMKLVEGWNNAKAAASAYEKVHDACDICWSKQIHLRSSATEYASAVGELTAEEIATMTKHGGSKNGTATLLKHYMMELFTPVLRVTSSFGKDDKDYVVL